MAEICLRVWGTPANFNGFGVLAALLHGTLVVGVSQTLRHWTDGATYIRQGAITSSIGPHSSILYTSLFTKQVVQSNKTNKYSNLKKPTRMWANAQPDGRTAEHRWRLLFNAAKFGWRPLLDAVQ